MPRIALALALLTLAGCATTPSAPRWQNPAAEAELQASLCTLAPDCDALRIELLDLDRPVAEIRARFRIALSRGLWQRTRDADERRFVLAHELGHRDLGHFRPRDLAARLPQELEADAWAAQKLCALGQSPLPGRALLQRLHDEISAAEATADPTLRELALGEYQQRIDRLTACATD